MSKFPIVRDLIVDRSRMFENLTTHQGRIPVRRLLQTSAPAQRSIRNPGQQRRPLALHDLRLLPRRPAPSSRLDNAFVGAQVLSQVRYSTRHPTGKVDPTSALKSSWAMAAITDCGNAQNCVKVCPKEIPLT